MHRLQEIKPFLYLATVYTRHPDGIEMAFNDAACAAALLIKMGVRNVYSPIAHTHPIAMAGRIDPLDYTIWKEVDDGPVSAAGGCAVVMMPGWEKSTGIAHEIECFRAAGKPVFYLSWPELEIVES